MQRTCAAFALIVFTIVCAQRAEALPVFAYRYGVSCSQCHTIVPHLNPFGQAFLLAGFRAPRGMEVHGVFPVAVKVNLAYSSAPSTLPKLIVDEVELLTGAPIGKNFTYRAEQYLVDGGVPGKTRDAWLRYTSRPAFGDFRPAWHALAGQFTLPLPVDPETQRDTLNHYAVFDQTVGANPFNFFDDRMGFDAAYGREGRGFDVHLLPLVGHDPQSGLPANGTDLMEVIQAGSPAMLFSAYRYDGTRPLRPLADRFWRQALALNALFGDTALDALAQNGFDASALGAGEATRSSGGYLQLRRPLGQSSLVLVRYDFISDGLAGSTHSVTTSFVFRPRRNARVTIEGVFGNQRTLNAAMLFAF